MARTVFFILLIVLISGCIGGGDPPPVAVYVTPCNVVGTGITFRTNGTELTPDIVDEPLSVLYVDDIGSDRLPNLHKYYELSCDWGSNPGELKNHYYCNGSYVAPEVDDQGIILRLLKKDFKIGFSVQEYGGEPWVDLQGRIHDEGSLYDLTIISVDAKCKVFDG